MIFNSIALFYLATLLGLLVYALYFIFNKITPAQNQALKVLRLAQFVWIFTIPVGIVVWLLSIPGSGAPGTKGSDVLWFLLLNMLSTIGLPLYALTNMGELYRSANYYKLLLTAVLPIAGIFIFVSFTLIRFY